MKTGIDFIIQERNEQIRKHGYSVDHDAAYDLNQLLDAAMFAITLKKEYYPVGWGVWFYDKMLEKQNRIIERLSVAGALIAAHIDVELKRITDEKH